MHDTHEFLQTLTVVLCAAAVTTVLFQRLRQPVVLGYLLAGLVVGPHVPIPLHADMNVVQTLAELGVILLMFSLGIEFSLQKLMHVGGTVGFVAVIQCSLLMWLGYVAGQAFGWTWLQSLYAGAAISISSTTIIVKAFEEQRVKGHFTQIVFGVLIVEDLSAILLITVLTTLSTGRELGARELAVTAGRLTSFLLLLFVVGMLTVPRLMRSVVKLDRAETTIVASVGIAFGFAYLAASVGYSVALGAFIAGSLVAESGVAKTVEHLVMPVRDMFAAIFFVSVGMMIDPMAIIENWPIVLAFLAIVIVGNLFAVTLGCFLTGQSVQTSIITGMSLAQIGEFSFIIAGVGVTLAREAEKPVYQLLYSIAIAVSGITTMLTPWLIRLAEPTAAAIDRKLPRSLQTFVALYGTWLEKLRTSSADDGEHRVRHLVRWLVIDAVIVTAIIIGASVELDTIRHWAQQQFKLSPNLSTAVVVAGAALVSAPFWIGMVRVSRVLGFLLASRVFPSAGSEQVDLAAAPRRLLIVTLQLAIVLLVGIPLVAITQPFVPTLRGAAVLVFLLALLAFAFWRNATNLQGHTQAAAQVSSADSPARRFWQSSAAERRSWCRPATSGCERATCSPWRARKPPLTPRGSC
jgi:CPA2 family monovalent cation:H+ antiporter-2